MHRNVFLGDARQLTKPLARRALRGHVDVANNYQPQSVKIQTMGKAATLFSVFAERWQREVLIHKKASTIRDVKEHLRNRLLPAFGKLAVGDITSEQVQSFANRVAEKVSAKRTKNIWSTLQSMWKSAVAWKYVTGELQIVLPKARKLRQRPYSQLEVKRILANSTGADQIFYWLAAEAGMRSGELVALRVADVDVENLCVEVSKSISAGTEGNPKSPAAFRTICISTRLGAAIKEYLAGRPDGYLFQTSAGNPWDMDNFRARKLNPLLACLEIPKIDLKILARIIGKDRTIAQANRSEKRAASVGLHSFRHTNATAMDSLGIQHAIRKQRLGHSGNSVTENYTHTFTQDERAAAEKLGEFFGTGWPEKGQGKVISFPNLSQTEKGPSAPYAESPCLSIQSGCGGTI